MRVFYECPLCGNIVIFENFSGNIPSCCGQEMVQLMPGTTDGDKEKHIPKCTVEDCKVKVMVGETIHPATADHYIDWIALETCRGYYKKFIPRGKDPRVCFHLGKEETPVAVYAYCNIHGLWVTNF